MSKSKAAVKMEMDLDNIPKLVGEDAKTRFAECMSLLVNTKWPLYLVGPSGSGKTVMAMNLAKAYSLRSGGPAYYVQLSPEQTKTSLILGLRLINGSLVPAKGVVAEAMERGGIIVVDEATHTTQELLLMFNSTLDRSAVTSIGDEIVYADDRFRVVFCANDSVYAGNVRLPQSFAQRLVAYHFDYPSFEDEVMIAGRIARSECSVAIDTPKSVTRYIVGFVRQVRSRRFPLSARNVASAVVRLSLAEKRSISQLDSYFIDSANIEPMRRRLKDRMDPSNKTAGSTALNSRDVIEFMEYVSAVGIDRFKEILLSSCMYYLDVDGMEISNESIKNEIAGAVL